MLRASAIVLMASLMLPGCGYMTQSGRQQIAYKRYVKKYSGKQTRNRAKFKMPRIPPLVPPSPDKVTAELSNSPESVTASAPQASE